MFKAPDMSLWTGRNDHLEGAMGTRWHQQIKPWRDGFAPGAVLLGFASDEGVVRNLGRPGAKLGPQALREALAGSAWHLKRPAYDAGDVCCDDGDLDAAQKRLGDCVRQIVRQGSFPLVLGGGHEVAYGSWQGLNLFANEQSKVPTVGIINLDAHFDLRAYDRQGSSGTPFKQIADCCATQGTPFHYSCFGVSRGSNTKALFECAAELRVSYRMDTQMGVTQLSATRKQLAEFMSPYDWLYLSIDLDVLPAGQAPGVSAPAAYGVELVVVEALIADIKASGKLKLADLAELNPRFDIDRRTARTAARLAELIVRD